MKVIYIADDGKEFDDEFNCREYEWKLNHPHLKDVCFYDVNNEILSDITSEETYNITERIVVPNEKALKDLHELTYYAGFCCYESINDCGEWVFNMEKGRFVRA